MPMYDFHCEVCSNHFEEIVARVDCPAVCPKCGYHTYKKLVPIHTGFVLRGGGWYQTDYKNKTE